MAVVYSRASNHGTDFFACECLISLQARQSFIKLGHINANDREEYSFITDTLLFVDCYSLIYIICYKIEKQFRRLQRSVYICTHVYIRDAARIRYTALTCYQTVQANEQQLINLSTFKLVLGMLMLLRSTVIIARLFSQYPCRLRSRSIHRQRSLSSLGSQ